MPCEIEWTDEDEAAAERAWARIRAEEEAEHIADRVRATWRSGEAPTPAPAWIWPDAELAPEEERLLDTIWREIADEDERARLAELRRKGWAALDDDERDDLLVFLARGADTSPGGRGGGALLPHCLPHDHPIATGAPTMADDEEWHMTTRAPGGGMTIDAGHDVPRFSPVCTYCRWWRSTQGRTCAAYPRRNSIPADVWLGRGDRHQRLRGDETGQKVHFEVAEGAEVGARKAGLIE
jgi:hypothetical protein